MFLKSEFSNRLVQVSLFSALVYYITAYPVVFESARKYFPVKFKKTHHLLIFHTFVFALLMYILTYFVFDPLVKVVEGGANGEGNIATGSGNIANVPSNIATGPSNSVKVLGDKVTIADCPLDTLSLGGRGPEDNLTCEDNAQKNLHTFTCTGRGKDNTPKMWTGGSDSGWTCVNMPQSDIGH